MSATAKQYYPQPIVDAMAFLKACGGLKEGPTTSMERRYVADQVVKKGPFAPYFSAMGITRGCQLKHTLDDTRSEAFFQFVYRLYCLFWLHTFDRTLIPQLDGVYPDHFFNVPAEKLKKTMFEVAKMYNKMTNDIRVAYFTAVGRSDIYKQEKQAFAERMDYFRTMPDENILNYCIACRDEDAAAAAIVLLMREMTEEVNSKQFFELREEDINLYLSKHAASRYYLMAFHNIRISATGSAISAFYADDGWIEKITGGRSHRDLNDQASYYAKELSKAWDAMKEMKRLDDADMTKIYKERDEHITHYKWMLRHLNHMDEDLLTTGEIQSQDIPEDVRALASRLAKIHGPVAVTTEASGMHLYIPDPELLVSDGEKELLSRHMAINVDKYFGLNDWDVDIHPTKENISLYKKYRSQGKEVPCCMSMKTGHTTTVAQLLKMKPIDQREVVHRKVESTVIAGDQKKYLVYDENGNLVPEQPGNMVPLSNLEENHPARQYLIQRGFDPDYLSDTYHVAYCPVALDEDRSKGRYWSKLPAGLHNTPQGRIIFPIEDEHGVRQGWQARAIDYKNMRGHRYLWTEKELWLQIEKYGKDLFCDAKFPEGFKQLRKYLNAKGLSRNQVTFGIRQAIEATKDKPYDERVCYVVEGVMDAMKGGPQCLAILGKSMSEFQAAVIRRHFSKVLLIADNDKAGREFVKSIKSRLPDMPVLEATLPPGKKDLGECSLVEAKELISMALDS